MSGSMLVVVVVGIAVVGLLAGVQWALADFLLGRVFEFRQAPRHPYPAQVADANYGTRWLKARAASFDADPASVAGLGTSSGGHTLLLSALRPADPRYAAAPVPNGERLDATLRYAVAGWPGSPPAATPSPM